MRTSIVILFFAISLSVAAEGAGGVTDLGEATPIGETAASGDGASAVQGAAVPGATVPLISTWDFVRMLLVLAAVVAAIYVILRLLKRGSRRLSGENELIRVIGSRVLSGSRSLHLVQVGVNLFLVGSSEGSVSLVAEISDKESVDTILLEAADASAPKRSFVDLLSGLFSPQGNGRSLGATDSISFVKKQKERLRGL